MQQLSRWFLIWISFTGLIGPCMTSCLTYLLHAFLYSPWMHLLTMLHAPGSMVLLQLLQGAIKASLPHQGRKKASLFSFLPLPVFRGQGRISGCSIEGNASLYGAKSKQCEIPGCIHSDPFDPDREKGYYLSFPLSTGPMQHRQPAS